MNARKIILIGIFLAFLWIGYFLFRNNLSKTEEIPLGKINGQELTPGKEMENMADNLDIPWEMAFLPNGEILVTEREGKLKKIGSEGWEISVPEVAARGEGGLLGMALHPDFVKNSQIYLYQTARNGEGYKNVLVRFTLNGNKLANRKIIVDNIPASANHNGGRIAFGPDGLLYVTTGDAEKENQAQNTKNLAGKILRVRDDGSIPSDNPFGNAVWSYGHRNPQGLAWDGQGRLWATEHGRSGAATGYDELNLIEKGENYGWPIIQGEENQEGMVSPVIQSGASATWAPSGATYKNGHIYFAGLRGQALYRVKISDNAEVEGMREFFTRELGRLRSVSVGLDGNLYIITNNTDGRGIVKAEDDKIIRMNPDNL